MSSFRVAHNQNAPNLPAYWRPADTVIDGSSWTASLNAADSTDALFSDVRAAAESRFGGPTQVLSSSYSSGAMANVYLQQLYDGIPVLNTQLHVIVGTNGARIIRANSSFANLSQVSVTGNATTLGLKDALAAARNSFTAAGGNADEWLSSASTDAKANLGWYLTSDGSIIRAYEISSSKCSLTVDASNGSILGFNSFIAY
ncbi:hypothetical protein BC830DRAFT_1095866 [Chytriomyces sp. MP71]|nr:hypothetical protein BC830DRAFT_1095866 [Chytriomyces sp. MP71]